MKKWKKVLGIGMAAVTFVTGCGIKEPVAPDVKTAGKQNVEITEDTKQQFSKGINDFSFRILEELQEGKNIFISPYSISMGFSMLVNGAQGETKEQIENVFGIPDLETWNRIASEYMEKSWGKDTFVKNANAIWVSDTMELAENAEKDYFSVVSEFYQAKQHYQDLTTDATREEINSWVKEHTGGMIEKILEENLDEDDRMALFNAIYFEGKWMEPFFGEDTKEIPFYGKKDTKNVDMMYLYDKKFSYTEKNGLRGIEVPYKDSSVVMDLVMPSDPDKDIMEVWGNLKEEEKQEFLKVLSEEPLTEIGTLGIPKFESEYTAAEELKEALENMGMPLAFALVGADFGKIGKDLSVGGVVHKAKVSVEENGTKAAAVTEIVMYGNCALPLEEETIDFIANRPFLYVIRDKESDVILFVGLMYEAE